MSGEIHSTVSFSPVSVSTNTKFNLSGMADSVWSIHKVSRHVSIAGGQEINTPAVLCQDALLIDVRLKKNATETCNVRWRREETKVQKEQMGDEMRITITVGLIPTL